MKRMTARETFQDLSTVALTHVIEANLVERSLSFCRSLGGQIYGPNPLWFITDTSISTANGVVRATFAPEKIDASIKKTLMPFKAQTLPLTWWVGPSTVPTDLGNYLQRHGFIHNRDMIGMAMDLLELPQSTSPTLELILEPVKDVDTLSQWYTIFLQGFPASFDQTYFDALAIASLDSDTGLYHYLGWLKGKIVTISSLFLGAGVAGLYNLTTLPELRGQGIGTLVTLKTFDVARAQGYRVATLQTTYPNALRLYHQLGFEVYCKISIYQYP